MVKVEKLNDIIDNLEIEAKEIINIVEKQKELSKLVSEMRILTNDVESNSEVILNASNNIESLIDDFNSQVIVIKGVINRDFEGLKWELIDGNKNFITEFKKQYDGFNQFFENLNTEIINEFNSNKDGMAKLENKAQGLSENFDSLNVSWNEFIVNNRKDNENFKENLSYEIKILDGNLIKKLNEIINENNKSINEFLNALEAKTGLLKSTLQLDIKNLESNILDLKEDIIIMNKESVISRRNQKNFNYALMATSIIIFISLLIK